MLQVILHGAIDRGVDGRGRFGIGGAQLGHNLPLGVLDVHINPMRTGQVAFAPGFQTRGAHFFIAAVTTALVVQQLFGGDGKHVTGYVRGNPAIIVETGPKVYELECVVTG